MPVLLVGERLEEVFLLGDGLPDLIKRRQLTEAVLANPSSPLAWWSLLCHVVATFGNNSRHA